MGRRHILHCDMNCFYASVEMQRHPELRNKPLAVCGSQEERHGIVLTANYIAKPYGVKTGIAIWQAKQRCPDLVTLPPDMDEYIRISRFAREIYEDYTDQVELFGLDECWLDVSGSVGLYGSPMSIAREISNRIKFELGITASIGVADNKVTSKLGSDYKKPDAITQISESNYKEIVYPLPVEDLLYVGPATSKKLRSIGISTIGRLAECPEDVLQRHSARSQEVWIYPRSNERIISPISSRWATPQPHPEIWKMRKMSNSCCSCWPKVSVLVCGIWHPDARWWKSISGTRNCDLWFGSENFRPPPAPVRSWQR